MKVGANLAVPIKLKIYAGDLMMQFYWQYFNQNYIATGKVEVEYSKILMEAQKISDLMDEL